MRDRIDIHIVAAAALEGRPAARGTFTSAALKAEVAEAREQLGSAFCQPYLMNAMRMFQVHGYAAMYTADQCNHESLRRRHHARLPLLAWI